MGNLSKILFCLCLVIAVAGCEKDNDSKSDQTSDILDQIEKNVTQKEISDADEAKLEAFAVPVKSPLEFTDIVPPKREPCDISLTCEYVDNSPAIDGIGNESIWQVITPVETLDFSSQRPIEIRSCHNENEIFFLVTYPDQVPSESHKSWIWDKEQKIYEEGMDREDALVLKWKMSGGNMSFSPALAEPHTADIWFWKARRTNPSGYFDDKYQIITDTPEEKAFEFPSDKFGSLYLQRPGDAGSCAYESRNCFEYIGDAVRKYYPILPTGSRADIKAKGIWADNQWTIEFRRKLDTGHDDDIKLESGNKYTFGVCLYEMAATGIEEKWYNPLYRTGNVFDNVIIEIK